MLGDAEYDDVAGAKILLPLSILTVNGLQMSG